MIEEKWREEKYQQVFDDVMKYVANQRKTDPTFTIQSLEAQLETEYINQGNDWVGRGEAVDLRIQATIAAYQQALANWRDELKKD